MAAKSQKARQGAGLRFLTGPITSPSLAELLATILAENPQARWHQYNPVTRDGARLATRLADQRHLSLRQGRRRRVARRRFPGQRPRLRALPEGLCVPPAGHRRPQGDEPLLCDREHAVADRRQGGSPPRAQGRRDRGVCAPVVREPWSRIGKLSESRVPSPESRAGQRRRGEVGGGARQRPSGAPGHIPGGRGRLPAGGGARGRARHEPGARQRRRNGHLRGAHRSRAGRPGGIAQRARAVDRRGTGGAARHPWRQSRLHRARRPEVLREAREGRHDGLSRTARRRDGEPVPMERRRGPSARELGRCARVRRHGHDHSAADCAAVRGPIGARSARCVHRAAGSPRLSDRQGLLDPRVRRGQRLVHPRRRRSAVQGRRHVLAPGPARRVHRRHRDRRRRTGHAVYGAVRGRAAPPRRSAAVQPPPPRRREGSRSSSGPIRRSGTAASRTTAGSRSCPSR